MSTPAKLAAAEIVGGSRRKPVLIRQGFLRQSECRQAIGAGLGA